MKRKILLLILIIFLAGCSKQNENPAEESVSKSFYPHVKYNYDTDKIEIVDPVVSFGGKHYLFNTESALNYSSKKDSFFLDDEYFVFSSNGEVGENENSLCIEINGAYLTGVGNKENIRAIFENIYEVSENALNIFNHSIVYDKVNEIEITDNAISISSGDENMLIYHAPLINGDPLVFYKELDGVDIPITYPEEEGFEPDYNPYLENTRVSINGVTPYSVYDTGIVVREYKKDHESSRISYLEHNVKESGTSYLVLTADGELFKDIFTQKKEIVGTKVIAKVSSKNINTKTFVENKLVIENPSEEIMNVFYSNNRYHTQFPTTDISVRYEVQSVSGNKAFYTATAKDSNGNEYYIDCQDGFTQPYIRQDVVNFTIYGPANSVGNYGLYSHDIIPSIKYVAYSYINKINDDIEYNTETVDGTEAQYLPMVSFFNSYENSEKYDQDSVGIPTREDISDTEKFRIYEKIGQHGLHEDEAVLTGNSGVYSFLVSNPTNREYSSIGDYLYRRTKDSLRIYRTVYSAFSGYITDACDPMAGPEDANNCYAKTDKADLEFISCYDSEGIWLTNYEFVGEISLK